MHQTGMQEVWYTPLIGLLATLHTYVGGPQRVRKAFAASTKTVGGRDGLPGANQPVVQGVRPHPEPHHRWRLVPRQVTAHPLSYSGYSDFGGSPPVNY